MRLAAWGGETNLVSDPRGVKSFIVGAISIEMRSYQTFELLNRARTDSLCSKSLVTPECLPPEQVRPFVGSQSLPALVYYAEFAGGLRCSFPGRMRFPLTVPLQEGFMLSAVRSLARPPAR